MLSLVAYPLPLPLLFLVVHGHSCILESAVNAVMCDIDTIPEEVVLNAECTCIRRFLPDREDLVDLITVCGKRLSSLLP